MKKFEIHYERTGPGDVCDVCHMEDGWTLIRLDYYTKDYTSARKPYMECQNLQQHPHTIRICKKCMDDLRRAYWESLNEAMEKGWSE